ncbi:MAG: NAD(P)-dependent oxidoreductase [Candidatus Dormibacteraeota bacterium]|uniref:NAD(P)-dependent oxidoreductase n=1 Tax=Candidatus Aeolococcus gillhamiae TaxID=3127015 RepID=A0A934N4F8_9BACT|nr:NAD(P)-dependent oxidoreductase [Candidatus Dormibacteraeota bacterium]
MRIGFIGLGRMGAPMCQHLIDAGHDLRGYDVDHLHAKQAIGARAVGSPRDLLNWADVIITMLPSGAALGKTLTGAHGLLTGSDGGFALVDMGTTSPTIAETIANEVTVRGGEYLEAPVSGGTAGAQAATLTIIAAGERLLFDRVRPVLEVLGNRVFFVGAAGCGQTLKLANNLLLAVNVVAVGEAWSLVRASGMDRETAHEVLTMCSGDSRALRTRVPDPDVLPDGPAARSFEPGFRVELMLKDIALAEELARHLGVQTPTLLAARDTYQRAVDSGCGELDIAIVADLIGGPRA